MSAEHYRTERETCEKALSEAVFASNRGFGQLKGWQGHWASFLHTRTIVTTMTIFDVIDAAIESRGRERPLDHFSVASIARTAVEAALMMLYISDPNLTSDEWELRHLILQLHDTSHRSRMFRPRETGENGGEIKRMRTEYRFHIDRIIAEIRTNPEFTKLEVEQRDRIVSCREYYVGGIRNVVRKAGWDVSDYDFFESYLSAYIHSMPMSFFRAEEHCVDFKAVSEFQYALCGTALAWVAHGLTSSTARMEELIRSANSE